MESTTQPRATPSDEALVVEAAAGETSAFALLVERYAAPVLAVVERSVADHHLARDLAQEVWIKVHRGLAGFRAERRFRPWLFAIALNHVRDDRRRAGRRPQPVHLDAIPVELAAEHQDPFERGDERAEIEAALEEVPEPYRGALHLVDVVGLGYEEAARSLSCSTGTVKSRVHRGRLAFQEAYLARERREPIRDRRPDAGREVES